MSCYNIMVLKVDNRYDSANEIQKVLTEQGCRIKTRLGIHEAENVCSQEGLIILQLCGDDDEIKELENSLNDIKGIKAINISI